MRVEKESTKSGTEFAKVEPLYEHSTLGCQERKFPFYKMHLRHNETH